MNKSLLDDEGEVGELTLAAFQQMRPIKELHPDLPRRVRGPQQSPVKTPVCIRLDPEVVAFFKASGNGWQTRLNAVLHEYVVAHRHE